MVSMSLLAYNSIIIYTVKKVSTINEKIVLHQVMNEKR